MDLPLIDRLNAALEGRYEVERQIGEGGMATVYLARDLKHNRPVALKVLKPELAVVVGAERFLTEIETTANLQHPHILPLFDSGAAETFVFYVMPYVEGETLRERIDRDKQLPVDEAVGIAVAVANALQHAHDKGVIHRDIKPGNILMQDGQPVVSDFGIAIAVGAAGGARMTETGLSMGTPYYMSPEQATGDQALGPGSDIYGLVAVLYEMLVGDPPYVGSTAQAVLVKILQGDPVSAKEMRKSIPLNVDAAIRKGLERLPADRFASGQELARALTDPAFRHGEAEAVGSGAGGLWNRLSMGLAAATVLFAAVATWGLLTRPTAAPERVQRYALGSSDDRLLSGAFTVAPDGSAMVYRDESEDGTQGLYLRSWDNLEATLIPGTNEGPAPGSPAISPDGAEVAYRTGSELRVVPIRGGVARTVTDSVTCCIRWGGDGYLYYMGLPGPSIQRVPIAGGVSERVTDHVGEGDSEAEFTLLPGARSGVFHVWTTGDPRIDAIDLESGERKVLTPGLKPYITTTGHLVFASTNGEILAAPFDPEALELTGPAVPLVENVVVGGEFPFYSLSDEGTLVYWSGSGDASLKEFVWVTRGGVAQPVDAGWTFDRGDTNAGWRLSPDGRRLALRELTGDGYDIWVKELDDGPYSRLTFHESQEKMPRWSADGSTVTFLSARGGEFDVWAMPFDGTGEPELVLDFDRSLSQGFYSPDEEWLILRSAGQANIIGNRDIYGMQIGVDSVPRPLISASYDEGAPALSHDSRWIAYNSTETGRYEVFLRPFPDVNASKIQVSTNGGASPLWSHAGDELFFVDGENQMVAAHLEFEEGQPRVVEREVLFQLPATYEATVPNNYIAGLYDITADDQRFLMVRAYEDASQEGPQNQFIVVKNWFEELVARVPTSQGGSE